MASFRANFLNEYTERSRMWSNQIQQGNWSSLHNPSLCRILGSNCRHIRTFSKRTRLLLELQNEVKCFILRMAAIFQTRKEQLIYLINNYDLVLCILMEHTRDNSKEAENFREQLRLDAQSVSKKYCRRMTIRRCVFIVALLSHDCFTDRRITASRTTVTGNSTPFTIVSKDPHTPNIMEFLWQKESSANEALYRDLFATIDKEFPERMFYDFTSMTAGFMEDTMIKSNAFSEQRRRQGNEAFKAGKWNDASKAYSECLCLAENNTEHVALAYANRSACHYALKMYGKCLVDIDLALREQLPERLKLKLEKRRADATELLPSDVGSEKFEVKLSYEADETFPFMANVLEIRKNDKFGRYITAKCDIPAGRTVVLENNFITHTKANSFINKDDASIRCISCNRIGANPIPCLKCTIVMFCGTECRDENRVHRMDCRAVYHWVGSNNKYIVQSVLVAVGMFATVDELMHFVLDALQAEKFEMPQRLDDDAQTTYRMFLKLWQPSKMESFVRETYTLYTTIMRLDAIKKVFDSTQKQRFLMHLMGQHAVILLHNAMEGQLGVFTALFNHSCAPNVQDVWIDNRTACMTIRPIRRGEQLFVCYMPEVLQKVHNVDVKSELYAKFEFRCKCVKCKDELADLKRIERDSGFCGLNDTSIYDDSDKVLLQDFMKKSVALLNKYSDLPWSYQLDHISKRLAFFMGRFYYTVEVK